MNFADRLASAIARTGTFACVGIDPVLDKLPPPLRTGDPHTAIGTFARGVIDAVADVVPIIKLQSACFERFGHRGYAQLEETAFHARSRGLLVILDAKRADIGMTAEHYAAAAFDQIGADALTVNPYLGPDTIEPFLRPHRGLFVLVRTSNPGSDEVQAQPLTAGLSVAELIAEQVTRLGNTQTGGTGTSGLSSVGAVVGATKASEAKSLRDKMPNQIFLIPGYGAQGGSAADIQGMLRPGQPAPTAGVLVTASRSVIYQKSTPDNPPESNEWKDFVRLSALAFISELAQITTHKDVIAR